jgi:secreted trypsin-like serine protease
MRRVLAPALAVLAAVALVPATAAAGGAHARLIGGGNATSTDVPWQALVLPSGHLCGGAILDATHVVTAAHCVYDEEAMEIASPSSIAVHAGVTNRYAAGQHPMVTSVSVNPAYDPDMQTGDVAVLTVAGPGFSFDPTVQPIGLTDVGYRPADTDNLRLSGWGSNVARSPYDTTTTPHAVDDLQVAGALRVNAGCSTVYAPFDDNLLLCAGQANLDACQGDSGGPLAVQAGGGWKLAGVVTGGAGCAWDGYPGYYARVASPAIHDFLANRGVGYAVSDPLNTSPPTIAGTARVGNTLTCKLGTWANAYAYGISWVSGGHLIAKGSDQLALGAALAGQAVGCVVAAWGLTGTAQAASDPVAIAGPEVAAPPAAPTPQVVPPLVAITGDAVAPTARVIKVRCGRSVCVLDVRADDPAPSSGIKGVEGTVSTAYQSTCKTRRGKRRACTKTVPHKLKTVLVAGGAYRITTPRLRRGRHTFSLLATDLRGNRQAKPTTVTKTTR